MKNSGVNKFAKKLANRQKVILYEFLPPPKNLTKDDVDQTVALFAKLLKYFPIDGVNLPEVREETRAGSRSTPELVKLEPRIVSRYFQKYGVDNLIINRPIVYIPWSQQQHWLLQTYEKYNIHNFIFVGGEKSSITYPGLSVAQAAKTVTQKLKHLVPEMCIGGITIPTRQGEPKRVLEKSAAGIEFFTTQILYEATAIKKFLKEYNKLCLQKEIKPKTIFLSFAPISSNRDIELLKWLGVIIPQQTHSFLAKGWLGMGWRSLKTSTDILEDILDFVARNTIQVPLGLNVEHVSKHNFELSFLLLDRLLDVFTIPGESKTKELIYV